MRLQEWLASRRPDPPAELDLRPWLEVDEAAAWRRAASASRPGGRDLVGPGAGADAAPAAAETPAEPALHERLMRAGLAALERAAARPGRVRESAFHLLAADALLTYACEAALESADPESALLRTLEAGFER